MREFLALLSRWFFAQGDPRTAAILRIAFCALYLFMLWDFFPAMPLLFGHAGMFGTLEPFPYELRGPQYLLFSHDSPAELQMWFWGSVVVTMLALVGFATRFTLLLTYISIVLFQERGPFMIFGADLVMRCVGVWLLFLKCGSAWSLDAKLWKRGAQPAAVEFWPVKAIQIQVALIYLVTGLLKLQSGPWQDGSAVYYAIQVGNTLKGQPAPWLLGQHGLLAFMTYATVFFEVTIPFMLFYRPLRFWAVGAAVLMHTGIDIYMSIRFFSPVMYMSFLAFLDDRDWGGWLGRLPARAGAIIARAPRPRPLRLARH